jgi:hypothetical protein
MKTLPSELQDMMQAVEGTPGPVSEAKLADDIRSAVRHLEKSNKQVSLELEAEWMAFSFVADYPDPESAWGVFFGPMMVGTTKDGERWESPSLKRVSADTLLYWQRRTVEAMHPVLVARYSDLVWELSKKITNKGADVRYAHAAIDAYLDAISRTLYDDAVNAIAYAKRALVLAISINDKARIERTRDIILALDQSVRLIDFLGTWGFAFDLLIEQSKVPLTLEQRQSLIDDLEKILADVAAKAETVQSEDPFISEAAAMRLANYYRRSNRMEDAHRVLRANAKVFLAAANTVSRMQAHGWVRRIYDLYNEYGMTADAEALSVQLRELGGEARKEMQPFSHKIEIPLEKVEQFVNEMVEGSLADALNRITAYFVPDPKHIEKQVKELAKVAPLMSMIRGVIMAPDGRDVAEVGSVEEDLGGRVVMQMSQNLQFEGLFLRRTMAEMAKRHNLGSQELLQHLYQSPLFENERRNILKRGLDAYFAGDHIASVHFLIPQVEHALRRFLVLVGRPSFRPGRHGGLNLRLLDDMLRDPAVVQVFGEQVVIYLQVLLTDQRGWNLRNELCHGIIVPDAIGSTTSDRIIHVLLILGNLRRNEAEQERQKDS